MSILQNTFLITEEYLKENSILNLNIDTFKLTSAITDAQTINIQQVLGTKLLKKILTDVTGNTLSGDYKILVDDFIIPALVKWTLYYASLDISFQWMNKGIVQRNSETSSPSILKDIQYLRGELKNNAEFLTQRLVIELCDNSYKYPEYFSSDDIMSNKNSAYSSGWVFSSKSNPMRNPLNAPAPNINPL